MEIKMPHYKFHSGKTLTEDSKVFKIYKIKDPVCHPYNNHIFCRVYQKYRNFHVLCALVNLYRFILTSKLILACPRICYHFYKVCKLHNDVGKAQPTTSVGVATRTYRFKMNPLFRCATLPNTFHSSWGFAKTFLEAILGTIVKHQWILQIIRHKNIYFEIFLGFCKNLKFLLFWSTKS